jgi:hypothetical protein
VPPGNLPSFFPPEIPGARYVILSAVEPPDSGELPPVTFPGPNGPVVVSDLLINGIANQQLAPPFIAFISDNNPDLALYVSQIPAGILVPVVQETGALQDLTPFMGPNFFPNVGAVQVMAQSDGAVPEPSSIVILLGFAGVGLIGLIRSRRHCQIC